MINSTILPSLLGRHAAAALLIMAFASPVASVAAETTTQTDTGNSSMTSPNRVKLTTNQGDLVIEVDLEKAPRTSENFLQYVKDGFYDNTIFHRVNDGFMVQGGGFEPGMKQKPTRDPIQNEANNGLKNEVGTIAMARTQAPHSATAQFFINIADNAFLNHRSPDLHGWGYCVFGRVIDGMDVVDAIRGVRTGSRGFHQDVPLEDVVIERAELV